MNQSIKLGVYHWQLFAGDDTFYPEDLPEDWRLSYFGNEFESACIDADWVLSNHGLWDDMTEGLDDRFCLVIELEDIQQWSRLHDVTEIPGQIDMLMLEAGEKDIPVDFNVFRRVDCWSPEKPKPSGLALMPSTATLKQYRQWIDQWMDNEIDADEVRLLWLDGSKTSYRQLIELRSLIELMGY